MEIWVSFVLVLARLIAEGLLLLGVPALIIKLFRRSLPFGLCLCASILIVFFPVLTFTYAGASQSYVFEVFSAWRVPGLKTFWILGWTTVTGAGISSLYSGLLLLTSTLKSTPKCALFFTGLSYVLCLIAFTIIPWIAFGDFGSRLASDSLGIFVEAGVLLAAAFVYVWFSDVRAKIYTA